MCLCRFNIRSFFLLMSRYYSEYDNAYYASGWQSPTSSIVRLQVDCPFGSKKCEYSIDKSQRNRLIVSARRRHMFPTKNKNDLVVQTYPIPSDADVNRLYSYVERSTNRLIIEIPRLSSYSNERKSDQKVEYHVDCRGYTADEVGVYVDGNDLIVQGKTKRSLSSDPSQHHMSQKFSRKISLPKTVDPTKVVSYFENGQLTIQAPVRVRERALSPVPRGNHRRHYHRRERISRHQQPSRGIERARSAEVLRYPDYKYVRNFDDDDDNYERYTNNRRYSYDDEPIYKSEYPPSIRTVYREYPREDTTYYRY